MKHPKKTGRARELRNNATPAEIRLWSGLSHRQIGGWRFRRQHPLGPYILDFYCPELKLAIELDGDSHGRPPEILRDARRTDYLSGSGVTVLRFWNNEIAENFAAVRDAIYWHAERCAARLGLAGEPGRPLRRQTRPPTRIQIAQEEWRAPRDEELGVPAAGGATRADAPPPPPLAHSREAGRIEGDRGSDNRHELAPLSPEAFAAAAGVSAETLRKLTIFDALLVETNSRHNLVARSTLADRWRRHYLDSAQIFAALAPGTKTLVDLGSGAGFPGLVLAAMGEGKIHVKLVESIRKKSAFLSTAAAAMGLTNVEVIAERVESLRLSPPDAIAARALAPLAKLLAYAHEIAGENTVCYFLKGQDVGAELTEASKSWSIDVEQRPSATAPDARLLIVRRFAPLVAPRIASPRVRAR